MREILFKAKSKNNEEWVEGYYAQLGIDDYVEHYIIQNMALLKLCDNWEKNMCFNDVEIISETLCQYTGMKDKNGKKIWENDIVIYDDGFAIIKYNNNCKAFLVIIFYQGYGVEKLLGETEKCDLEVIGNIFDNSDLLKAKE